MERLTKRYDTHVAVICDNCDKKLECKYGGLDCGSVLRERLAAYEDTGLTPEEIIDLISPPNPPLTLEELREMEGEPVFLVKGKYCGWVLITGVFGKTILIIDRVGKEDILCDGNKNIWTVYRRKPEEGTT